MDELGEIIDDDLIRDEIEVKGIRLLGPLYSVFRGLLVLTLIFSLISMAARVLYARWLDEYIMGNEVDYDELDTYMGLFEIFNAITFLPLLPLGVLFIIIVKRFSENLDIVELENRRFTFDQVAMSMFFPVLQMIGPIFTVGELYKGSSAMAQRRLDIWKAMKSHWLIPVWSNSMGLCIIAAIPAIILAFGYEHPLEQPEKAWNLNVVAGGICFLLLVSGISMERWVTKIKDNQEKYL